MGRERRKEGRKEGRQGGMAALAGDLWDRGRRWGLRAGAVEIVELQFLDLYVVGVEWSGGVVIGSRNQRAEWF